MEKVFKDLSGSEFTVEFEKHDISKYDVLFHVTLKDNRKSIEENGLLRNQPKYKSLIDSGLLFMSYPVDMNTSDCFRWSDEYHSLIVLDAKKLQEDGYVFYDDYFGKNDQSSKRNHLCCDVDIPAKYIKKVLEF
jgi:RNA:NAD 2'-phosphotransferase (TPT1/KptA family)